MAQSTYSLSFARASSQYAATPTSVAAGTRLTVSCWLKLSSLPSSAGDEFQLVCRDGTTSRIFQFRVNQSNQLQLVIFYGGGNVGVVSGSTTLTTGVWYHCAGTFDGTTARVYLNGVSDGSGSYSGNLDTGVEAVTFGDRNGSSNHLNGQLDDIALASSDLGSTVVGGLAAGTTDPSTLTLSGLWRLEEGSGFTLTDTSGNSHNASTSNSPTWSTDVPTPLAGGGGSPVTATPGVKALTLAAFAPTVLTPRLCTPGVKSLTLTAFAPAVLTPRVCVPGVRALTLTTFAPTAAAPRVCVPGVRSLALAAFVPAVSTPRVCTPGAASLTLATSAPAVLTPRLVTPGVTALTLTTFAPAVQTTAARVCVPGVKSLTLTTFAPTILAPRLCAPGVRALALTSFAPTVVTTAAGTFTPGTRALTLGAFAPTVLVPRTCTPGVRSLALSAFAPSTLTPRLVTPSTRGLPITLFAPTILAPRLVTPGTRALTMAGRAPTILVTSAVTAQGPVDFLAGLLYTPGVSSGQLYAPGWASGQLVFSE